MFCEWLIKKSLATFSNNQNSLQPWHLLCVEHKNIILIAIHVSFEMSFKTALNNLKKYIINKLQAYLQYSHKTECYFAIKVIK